MDKSTVGSTTFAFHRNGLKIGCMGVAFVSLLGGYRLTHQQAKASKVILCIWWNEKGVIYYELLLSNVTITAEVCLLPTTSSF